LLHELITLLNVFGLVVVIVGILIEILFVARVYEFVIDVIVEYREFIVFLKLTIELFIEPYEFEHETIVELSDKIRFVFCV
jgi:hypothetical protein